MAMFDVRSLRADFSRAAVDYDALAQVQRQVRAHCITLGQACWAEGTRLLDAGCGTGALAQEVEAAGLGWRITGLDLAFGMCAAARQKNVPVVNGDSAALPFADSTFDGIFSSLMLQWANDPLVVLRELARVTAAGGCCVLATLADGTLRELRAVFVALHQEPRMSSFPTAADLKAAATEAGWRVRFMEEDALVEYYSDATNLMLGLKHIGAADKRAGRRRGLTTPRQLSQLAEEYEWRFGGQHGLPLTWQVVYLVMEKA
jgi:malonyl-CoA O-methyltransferase